MSKIGNATKKVLAAVLTMLLVFGMVPVSAIPTIAATTDYPEAVTVTVEDGNGNVVSGAQVSFTITDSADVEIASDTVTTNANGSAEVLAKAKYKDGLKLKGTVTKDGYDSKSIESAITSDDANIVIEISKSKVADVAVSAVTREFQVNESLEPVAGDAVIITGLKEGDEVSYQMNGVNSDTMPQISKVGTYNVTVVVERTGYENFVATVVSEITEKKVEIDAQAIENLTYTGEAQTLVKINNEAELKDKYGVTLNYKTSNVGVKAQNYTVIIEGTSTVDGIVVEEKTLSAVIAPAAITDEMFVITPYSADYDAAEHDAVAVELKIPGKVEYKLGDGEWTTACPKIKDAGEYAVKVKVVPNDNKNYAEKEIDITVNIKKADREFKFSNNAYNSDETTIYKANVVSIKDNVVEIKKGYGFSAVAENATKEDSITYDVDVLVGGEGAASFEKNTPFLNVKEPGVFTITATVAESKNYKAKEISHTINVKALARYDGGERAAFVDFGETETINYYVNKNSNVISETVATATIDIEDTDKSNITYSISPVKDEKAYDGIACDVNTGKVYIKDFDAFIASLNRAGGLLKVKVEATKSEGVIAASDKDSYIINIQYAVAPGSLFTMAMSLNGTGWIKSEVTVTPNMGYTIAKAAQSEDTTIISHDAIDPADDIEPFRTVLNNAFTGNVKFGDDGQNVRTVYVCDNEGYIYAPVDVKMNINGIEQDLKVDRTAPTGLSIKKYSTELNSIGDAIKTLFYKDVVTVTFEATDEMSGVQRFTCEYAGKEIPVENFTSVDGKSAEATATITIAEGEEFNGNVTFTAYDRAGNATQKTGDDTVIVDYVSPNLTVEYENPVNVVPDSETTPKTYYFNETTPLVFKAIVKETNASEDNGIIKVFKDGVAFDGAIIEHKSETDGQDTFDIYTVQVDAIAGRDGVYTVEVYYSDKSTNQMEGNGVETVKIVEDGVEKEVSKFVSDKMVIDTINPVIEFEYKENAKHNNTITSCTDYIVKVTVKEVNFNADDFTTAVKATDIKENPVTVAGLDEYIKGKWVSDGDTHVCTFTYGEGGILPDAIYENIKFEYTDLAENSDSKDSGEFIVDTTAPTAPKIGYDKPVAEVVLENTMFGFAKDIIYKFFGAPTKVTLSSTDETSGVQNFVLKYNREPGASETNKLDDIIDNIKPVQDKNSKNIFEATVTIPKSLSLADFEEIRGNLTAYAVDNHGINSETVNDNDTVVIVDSITPEVSVEYSPTDVPTVGNKTYYNEYIEGKIIVKEANFLPDTVTLSLAKDGVAVAADKVPAISWEEATDADNNVIPDTYVGKFTIYGKEDHATDGDYVVGISCKNKSTNKIVDYKSNILVLDTTAPEIEFEYKENNKHDNKDDNCEDYTVKVTVKEHNFNADDFKTVISEKDVVDIKGNDVAVAGLDEYIKGNWVSDGDTHVCTFTYGEGGILPDAIYNNIKFEYTDLAKNSDSKDSGEFIVDTTAPSAPKIEYETSLWPVIGEVLTLGLSDEIVYKYFDAPTTITLTSTDDTWGVEEFVLDYNRENGESKTNVEKIHVETSATKKSEPNQNEFTAQIKLPKEEADQIRGSLTAYAIDKHGINSNTVTDDETVVVVDTISSEMSVSYSEPNRTVGEGEGATAYYNAEIEATITITEANFYSEDVELTVTRDGVEIADPEITWTGTVDAEGNKEDTYKGVFTLPAAKDHSTDGDYIVSISYKDRSTDLTKEGNTKTAAVHTSHKLVIDTTAPVINVVYSNTASNTFEDPYLKGVQRDYFSDKQVATITITEHNFDEGEDAKVINISEKDIINNDLSGTYVASGWGEPDGDNHSMTIDYLGNANYSFDMSYTDLAGNGAVYGGSDVRIDYFTVDTTAPIVKYEQINRVGTTILKNITFGTFKEKAEIKVVAEDDVSPIDLIEYKYNQTEGTSSVNKAEENGKAVAKNLVYDGKTATFTFVMPKGKLEAGNNMHGRVDFIATNRAGIKSTKGETPEVKTDIVVDSIAPNVTIAYSKAYKTENGISYYDGKITGTITVVEANFNNSNKFNLYYSKDGAKNTGIPLKWTATKDEDTYVATFTLTADGDYIITADYKDVANNSAEFKANANNKGTKYNYKSNQLTIDTKINAPVITFNGVASGGGSFPGDFTVGIKFEDDNYDSYQATLTRTRYDEKDINVTGDFVAGKVAINANGGSGSFGIPRERINDGVYTLTVRMTDKVNHSSTTTATFVVNRLGSVYVYNDALIEYLDKGYIQDVDKDIVITEYNPNKLLEGSLRIDVSKGGHIIDDAVTSTAPVKNNGWYEYTHTINKENFSADGRYKISIFSNDESGRTNDSGESLGSMNEAGKNTMDARFAPIDKVLTFKVDKAIPEIDSITFNEVSTIRYETNEVEADEAIATIIVEDTSGIKDNVKVTVDGIALKADEVRFAFSDDRTKCTITFTLKGRFNAYEIGLYVEDQSGRILSIEKPEDIEKVKDSVHSSFTGRVLVSTNILAQFWNNQPVFWGVVGGTLGAAALVVLLIVLKKRKNKDKK